MSWIEIPCDRRRGKAVAREHVQAALSNGYVRLYIGAEIIAALGWSVGHRVTVLRGDGTQTGKLIVARREHGGWKLQRHRSTSSSAYLRLPVWPGVVEIDRRAVVVRHRVAELKPFANLPSARGLEIDLPSWGQPHTHHSARSAA
jgi:hypothetical protein